MKKLSSTQVRDMYLNFFKDRGHTIMPSASLIPQDDPSLLWINSGVATMKKYFEGRVVPKSRRMTSSQPSIRTNDIENVGKTARHQTMFEMLGNFSVGDYFKEQAIKWAFELLTSPDYFGWDKDKLYMTVYPKDTDAKKFWQEAGVAADHLVDMEDNFWDVGQGPSGPDSEIFYDRGPKYDNLKPGDPEDYPGGENSRWLEVWNIVFSQFNHKPDGTYVPLPRKNIDTGMGLERVVSIFQDAPTNFETDLFLPIIKATEKLSDGRKYGASSGDDVAFKIIADHIRAISFAIHDGALPSNVGRGYVIRRLLRRAIVAGRDLGITDPFLHKLVPVVGEIMKVHYPGILKQSDYISKVVESEEKRFNDTLADGLNLLNDSIKQLKTSSNKTMSGKEAFKLYDTYGFPFELTKEYLNDEGLNVNEEEFNSEMKKQKDRARNARGDEAGMTVQNEALADIKSPSKYVGYDQLTVKDALLSDIIVNQNKIESVSDGKALLIFNETPFYAEMGGQVADRGIIKDQNGNEVAKVVDVQHAPNGQNIHTVEVEKPLTTNNKYELIVDRKFHSGVEKNHTATHLLDQALRNVLGGHTQQAGSLVEPNYLRFDFTHFGQVTDDDLKKVEDLVNKEIFAALPVKTVVTDPATGHKMGAVAIFTSKYGKKVRVVNIGDFSVEFCGGDHVKNSAQLGLFKIVSESGVGAGVRRIEAVTSEAAFNFLNHQSDLLSQSAKELKVAKLDEVPNKVSQLQTDIKKLQQKQTALAAKLAGQQADKVFENVQEVNGIKLIVGNLKNADMGQLRQLADNWRNKHLSNVLVLGTANKGKANLVAAVDDETIQKGIKAGDLIKAIAPKVNGGGGGRPNMAQAGGSNPAGLEDALETVKTWLSEK